MKQGIYPKLNKIENELKQIKLLILQHEMIEKKPIKLKGLLKGAKFDEKDFEEAKRAVFKHAYDE